MSTMAFTRLRDRVDECNKTLAPARRLARGMARYISGTKSHVVLPMYKLVVSGTAIRFGSMTSSSELVAVDLTGDERGFIQHALYQWQFSAAGTPFPIQVLGLATWGEFDKLTGRLSYAVTGGRPLTDLDWARVLYLTECSWASGLVGAGPDFAIVIGFSDKEAVGLLRGLQRKIGGSKRAELLFPGGSRPRSAEQIEERKRWAAKVRREQQGRQYPPGL